jgi:hypothetical protein
MSALGRYGRHHPLVALLPEGDEGQQEVDGCGDERADEVGEGIVLDVKLLHPDLAGEDREVVEVVGLGVGQQATKEVGEGVADVANEHLHHDLEPPLVEIAHPQVALALRHHLLQTLDALPDAPRRVLALGGRINGRGRRKSGKLAGEVGAPCLHVEVLFLVLAPPPPGLAAQLHLSLVLRVGGDELHQFTVDALQLGRELTQRGGGSGGGGGGGGVKPGLEIFELAKALLELLRLVASRKEEGADAAHAQIESEQEVHVLLLLSRLFAR